MSGDWMSQQTNPVNAKFKFRDEKDIWWKGYYGTSFASRQREYFAG
jgi:hypothetical protein